MTGLHILWYRQDLRVHDHAPLKAASLAAERDGGHVLPLYIFEPEGRADDFLIDSLRDLERALDQRDAALHFRSGVPVDVLTDLHRAHNVLSVYSHETSPVRAEDREVEAWCLRAGVAFRIFAQFGPEHGVGDMACEQSAWEGFMASPRHEAPTHFQSSQVGVGHRPPRPSSPVTSQPHQRGGRKTAIEILRRMLGPVSDLNGVAAEPSAVSQSQFQQLLPYLELGTLSVREAWQAAIAARNQYHAAGQDIRAARVTELIENLPHFYQARGGVIPGAPVGPDGAHRRNKPEADGQLSLDLG